MSGDQIDALQTKIAYLEDTVQTLSDIVGRQQKEIEELKIGCQQLLDRQKGLAQMLATDSDERPPHY